MADKIENLILEHLKSIRSEVGGLSNDMKDVKSRLTELERGQAMLLSGQADGYGTYARQQSVIDRLNERISRIEKRLELTD